ncbi:methylcobamide:CoM methyltransferase MtaA [Methanohalophilus euhalobius]|uniref:Methanol-specific methylcobalamin: coenzyme M methyltransferase n=1 Tax=Methanohalophilus euhalobius TaxID=51203 RepID=A0A314ZXJ4_9EURY|nr:methylcobamide:CoM methyltransferase MtaA [Methanohalophilus euhalobius]PQV43343.1 methanol-specific methylcobalamin: coenzyme M methyltransferase [Methanohalophilus euhalobius]RNI07592.1 MtaA/CmuA family methyltransferase [Methanohalophilus euhalobius]
MSELTQKNRLTNALKGESVDKAPVASVTQTATVELMEMTGASWPEAHSDASKMAKLALASHTEAGLEAVRYPFCLTVLAEAMGCEVNMGTQNRQPSITEHPYKKGVDDLKMPDNLAELGRIPAVVEATDIVRGSVGEDVPIIAGMEGPVTLASDLASVKKFMKWSIKKPDDFKAILDFATDACIEYANILLDSGVDMICVADPVASPDLMNPATFNDTLKPCLAKFAEAVDCIKILHICGNVTPILDMMADCKFEGLSIEEKVKDVKEAKKTVEGRATLVGNVSSPFTILSGTPEKVKEEVKKALDDGISVVAPGCGIAPNSPLENVKALVEGRDEYFS